MPARLLMPAVVAGAMAGLVIIGSALDVDLPGLAIVAVCAVSYACGAYGSMPAGAVGATVLLVALLVLGDSDSVVPPLLATVGPWAAGYIVRTRQELIGALGARTRELEAEQDAFARLAVRRERARIAHELHDIVAHHLAVMVIHAGAGRMASPGDGADGERLDSIRQAGDQALAEMTRLVAMLQSDAEDGPPERGRLRLLLDQARATGLDVSATPLPDVRLAPEVEDGAYRLVQEGLTNAMKHAPGSKVALRLSVRADALEIELRDSAFEARHDGLGPRPRGHARAHRGARRTPGRRAGQRWRLARARARPHGVGAPRTYPRGMIGSCPPRATTRVLRGG
jgi:signal transduction histidine kinase